MWYNKNVPKSTVTVLKKEVIMFYLYSAFLTLNDTLQYIQSNTHKKVLTLSLKLLILKNPSNANIQETKRTKCIRYIFFYEYCLLLLIG